MREGAGRYRECCSIYGSLSVTILAQHGWGKTNKIERGIENGSVEGVILSPRDESPANLASLLNNIAACQPSVERLVDPQLYAATTWPVRDGRLAEYPHYRQNMTSMSFSPAEIRSLVREALAWQYGLNVSAVVSPTVIVEDLQSQWSQIAMMLAQETVDQHDDSRPLLISIAVEEGALRHRLQVHRWLDDLSQLDVEGFYAIVQRRPQTFRQHYDSEVLASLLLICFSLAELNEYRMYIGYTDMPTLLLHAVGVTGTGSGWSTGLRQFDLRRFQPVSGGRQPRPRYSSLPLMNSIYMTELDAIYNGGSVADVLSGTPFDTRFIGPPNPENVPWPADEAALHHWQVLARLSRSVLGGSVGDRLDRARGQIAQSLGLYAQIGSLVPFTTETSSTHLDQWLNALNRFRSEAAV